MQGDFALARSNERRRILPSIAHNTLNSSRKKLAARTAGTARSWVEDRESGTNGLKVSWLGAPCAELESRAGTALSPRRTVPCRPHPGRRTGPCKGRSSGGRGNRANRHCRCADPSVPSSRQQTDPRWPPRACFACRGVESITSEPGKHRVGCQAVSSAIPLFLVQDLVISAKATCYLRERWITPDGQTIVAPLPQGIAGHFGPELRPLRADAIPPGSIDNAPTARLIAIDGVAISKRQLVRLLNENHEGLIAEAQDVLRAGLETSPWVSVDDTGARHAGKNGFCTQIGNEWFTWFRTRSSKSRLNFLDLLHAGHTDYVLNDAAYDDMRNDGLPAARSLVWLLNRRHGSATRPPWQAHLDRLGLTGVDGHARPRPGRHRRGAMGQRSGA